VQSAQGDTKWNVGYDLGVTLGVNWLEKILQVKPRLSFLLVLVVLTSLLIPVSMPSASAAACADSLSNGYRIAPSHGQVFYIDTGVTPRLDAAYVAYRVTSTTAKSNLWIELSGFTGGRVSLANSGDYIQQISSIEAGQTHSAFFLLKASGTETTTDQVHSVKLYEGKPRQGGVESYACEFTFTDIRETIKASANKVQSVTISNSSPALGSLVDITAIGQMGTIGQGDNKTDGDIIWVSPAGFSSWPTQALRLEDVVIVLDRDGDFATTGDQNTYTDQLLLSGARSIIFGGNPSNKLNNSSKYRAVYSFRVVGSATSTFPVAPVAQISSGTQYKHSDTNATASGAFPLFDLRTVSSTMTVTKTIAPKATVTNKALTSNVSTLTTSAAHGFAVGDVIYVNGVDDVFNGEYTVASVPSTTTLTYSRTNANIASASGSGGIFKAQRSTVSSRSSSGTTRTIVTSAAHNLVSGQSVTITDVDNVNFNGIFTVTTIVSSTSFSFTGSGNANVPSGSSSGTVTASYAVVPYSILVTSSDSTSVDEIVDTPTSGTLFISGSAFLTDSQRLTSTSISDPSLDSSESTLDPRPKHFIGPFHATSSSPVNLQYSLIVPTNASASYTNDVYARSGSVKVGSSATAFPRVVISSDGAGITGAAVSSTLAPPTATTGSVTSLGSTTATISGVVDPNSNLTLIKFQYGTSPTLATSADAVASTTSSSSDDNLNVTSNLISLDVNSTYYYRVVGTYTPAGGSSTTVNGEIRSFTTNLVGSTSNVITWPTIFTTTNRSTTSTLTQSSTLDNSGNNYASSGLQVILISSTPSVCTVTSTPITDVNGDESGITYTISLVGDGTCTLTASQDGNATYAAAESITKTFTVTSNNYTVTYNANSATTGSAPTDAGSYATGATVTVLGNTGSLTKTGYTFNGWCTTQPAAGASCSGTSRAAASTFTMGSANVTLYAVWSANSLNVTFDTQGGSSIASTTTTTGASLSDPGTPTKSGYTFNGWFAASTGGSALSFPYAHGRTADFTLYAQWLSTGMEVSNSKFGKLRFNVFFDLNGVKLDSKDKRMIRTSYKSVQSKLTSKSVVTVVVYGWVQPTKKSPNVLWLSENRAKAVVAYLKELGLKAGYTIKTPGHDVTNTSTSRRATTFIEWSNSK
jgi:uncharacterized repeat protein (TIGR02543 family)